MKLTPAAEFALRGSLILAEYAGGNPVTLDTICAERDLPKQYLVKIFASLARAGLVKPVRGKHGGYLLARDPDKITILEVIEAVEGPLAMNLCQKDPPECEEWDCPIRPAWAEIQEFIQLKLGSLTLGSCAKVIQACKERKLAGLDNEVVTDSQ